jgi:hypothetical protein
MDIRGIPLNNSVSFLQPAIVLEQAQTGFTIGNAYNIYALIVDSDSVLPQPKPYILTIDDDGHFRILDMAKVRRA